MDTGEYVGAGIGLVESSYGGRKNIFLRVNHRAKIRTIFKKSTDDQADGHSGKEEGAHPVVIFSASEMKNKSVPATKTNQAI